MNYFTRHNPSGKGFDVWYENMDGEEQLVVGWEKLSLDRAERMAQGGNTMLHQIVAASYSFQDDIIRFHKKFDQPAPDAFQIPSPDALEFRARLVREEAEEAAEELEALAGAVRRGRSKPDTLRRRAAACLHELTDSLVVGFGGFVIFGVRAEPFWGEVCRANLDKRPNPKGGKPIKPKDWRKADCGRVLDEIKERS